MPISQVPLEIESYYVREIHLTTNTDYDPAAPSTGEVDVDFAVSSHPEKPTRFQVAMSISVSLDEKRETNEPYSLHMHLHGFFNFKAETEPETMQKMLFSNAVPIVYGIARGCVGQLTGTAFNGALMLPAFNFVALAEKKKAAKENESRLIAAESNEEASET
jgi:preprotein translocase subunit SecB